MYEQYHPLGVVGIISAFTFSCSRLGLNNKLAWIAEMSVKGTKKRTKTSDNFLVNTVGEVSEQTPV
jgi:hypothetical protein